MKDSTHRHAHPSLFQLFLSFLMAVLLCCSLSLWLQAPFQESATMLQAHSTTHTPKHIHTTSSNTTQHNTTQHTTIHHTSHHSQRSHGNPFDLLDHITPQHNTTQHNNTTPHHITHHITTHHNTSHKPHHHTHRASLACTETPWPARPCETAAAHRTQHT